LRTHNIHCPPPPKTPLCRYKDAVKECSSALETTPSSGKALRSRAKALEKQGLYKQALADIQVGRGYGVVNLEGDTHLSACVLCVMSLSAILCLTWIVSLLPAAAAAPAACVRL
jgi:hypothetical protein